MAGWLKRVFHRRTELDSADAYERWAPTYPSHAHNELMQLEERAVLHMMPNLEGVPALDAACGSGRYLKIMLQRGAARVVGLDASAPMLARARDISPNLVQADLLRIGLRGGRFRLVVCGLALGHVQDLRSAMAEISRVLIPGGTVIYSEFHPISGWLRWKRTFRWADGREYVVRRFMHSFSDHVAACAAAGLVIDEVREPAIDFEHKWQGFPAVLVIRATKAE